MDQQEARDICESLAHDLETHEGRAILDVIEDVEFSWTMHEANAQELADAMAANLDPGRRPHLFDRDGNDVYRRELAVTTRRLANYGASACALIDRVEAIACAASCPPRLRSRLGKLRNDMKDLPVVAFFRIVRDGYVHFAPQHVSAMFGPSADVLVEPRRSRTRQLPQAALSYIGRFDAYGVPLVPAQQEMDTVLRTFTAEVTAAFRSEFGSVLADYNAMEAEGRRLSAIAWPEAEHSS